MITMKYYNQNKYSSIKYPSTANKNATVKTSGCGVCCVSMIVENMTGKNFPPAAAAAFSIQHGARVAGGTDMHKLSAAIAQIYGLTVEKTSDETKLVAHLKAGGMAIANVGGDRTGYKGVFSNIGHFIVVAGLKNNRLIILDPGYYSGKFNKQGRAGKVIVGSNNELYTTAAVLDVDTKNRTPSYYLFKKEGAEMKVNQTFKLPDGRKITMQGLCQNDTNYTPVRKILEALGYVVYYRNGVIEVSKKG